MWQIVNNRAVWLTAVFGLVLIWVFAGLTVGGLGGVENVAALSNAEGATQLNTVIKSGDWSNVLTTATVTLMYAFSVTVETTKGQAVSVGLLALPVVLTGWLLTVWGLIAGWILRSLTKMVMSAVVLSAMFAGLVAIGAQRFLAAIGYSDAAAGLGLYVAPNWIGVALWPTIAVLIAYLALRQLAPRLFTVRDPRVQDDGFVWFCPSCAVELRPDGVISGQFALCPTCKGRIEETRTYLAQHCLQCGRGRLVGSVCCYHCGEIFAEET